MPISFRLQEPSGIVYSTASGIVSCDEVMLHLDAMLAADVLARPEIFDARNVTLDLSVHDLQAIGDKIQSVMRGTPQAALALVTNNHFVRSLGETYGQLTRDHGRPFGIFPSIAAAEEWMQNPVQSSGPAEPEADPSTSPA